MSFDCLQHRNVHVKTQGKFVATQDQTLTARAMLISSCFSICRLCGEHNNTVQHLLSGCKFLVSLRHTVNFAMMLLPRLFTGICVVYILCLKLYLVESHSTCSS